MKTPKEIKAIIASSTGTESYHRFTPLPDYPVATDGQAMAFRISFVRVGGSHPAVFQ